MLIAEVPSVAADRKTSMLQSAHLSYSSSSAEVRSASDQASAGLACESPTIADDVPKIVVTPVENAPPPVSKVYRKFLGAELHKERKSLRPSTSIAHVVPSEQMLFSA